MGAPGLTRLTPVASTDNRVLIAGAGPVGLVLALSLARAGHRVTVVEKLVDLLDQARRAGTIHAATLEMLDDLGLYERLEARGIVAPLVHYWDRGRPEPIAVFDHGVLADDARFPHALQCDRLKVVEEALKAASNIDLAATAAPPEKAVFNVGTGAITTFDGLVAAARGIFADLDVQVVPGRPPPCRPVTLSTCHTPRRRLDGGPSSTSAPD